MRLACFVLVLLLARTCLSQPHDAGVVPDDPMDTFLAWVTHHGGYHSPKIKIEDIPSYGRGVMARDDIKEGERIISIPFDLTLSHSNTLKSDLKAVVESLQLSPTNQQAIHLLYEKYKPDSFWKPYIDILPRNFTTSLFFSEEEMGTLQASPLRNFTIRRKESIADQHRVTFSRLFTWWPEFFSSSQHTLSELEWALSAIWSRAFSFSKTNGGLVPLADLFNAVQDRSRTKVRVEVSKDKLEYFANADIDKDTQIFTPYGVFKSLSNAQLLMDYGFVLEDGSTKDNVMIVLDPINPKQDPYIKDRETILDRYDLGYNEFKLEMDNLPHEVRATIRCVLATQEELRETAEDRNEGLYKVISPNNEMLMTRMLLDLLRGHLSRYPTTLEDDETLLANSTDAILSTNTRNAIVVRMGEKRILRKWVSVVESELINLTQAKRKRRRPQQEKQEL
eukprot:TRINITY_DN5038_c0_g1_i3.p1 TRINITY_DN5038_c0_g1~~TRINITY_DN5038_c0_g1_i3.p1  ORF type:complete len:450 (+),score=101.11 TRINITY_DN5038_c0_g1_i3:360-1709(+)